MTFVRQQLKCGDCIRPVARRLGLFDAKDEYECYADSYVKCFWGLCDAHQSMESFSKTKSEAIGKILQYIQHEFTM